MTDQPIGQRNSQREESEKQPAFAPALLIDPHD
jgi:hypothetical protein